MSFNTMPITDGETIPQANDPHVLAAAAVAIGAGCAHADEVAKALGDFHPRQGAYYAAALLRLGLVDRDVTDQGHLWSLTALGQSLADAPTGTQAAMLANVLSNDDLVIAALSSDEDEQALVELACEDAGLTGATIARRVSTIRAWAEFVTMTTGSQEQAVASATAGVAARTAEVIRARTVREAEQAAKAAAAAPKYCCGQQMPATGICDWC